MLQRNVRLAFMFEPTQNPCGFQNDLVLAAVVMFGAWSKKGGKWDKGKGKGKGKSFMGKGKGKGKSKSMGAGKMKASKGWVTSEAAWPSDQSWEEPAWEPPTTWDQSDWTGAQSWEGDGQGEWSSGAGTGRILVRNSFPHSILRAYADDQGSMLYADGYGNDLEFLKQESLLGFLTAQNSNMHRNPAVGMSTMAGSIKSMRDIMSTMGGAEAPEPAIAAVAKLLDNCKDLGNALESVHTRGKPKSIPRHEMELAVKAFTTLAQTKPNVLFGQVAKLVTITSRLYAGAAALLEVATAFSDLTQWSAKIPDDIVWDDTLSAWQADPANVPKLIDFLCTTANDKKINAQAWSGVGGNNTAAALLQGDKAAGGKQTGRGGTASRGEPANKKTKFSMPDDDEDDDAMIAAAENWGADKINKALVAAQAMGAAETLTLQIVKNWFDTVPQESKEDSGLKEVEDEIANRRKLTKAQGAAIAAQIMKIMNAMQAACPVPEEDEGEQTGKGGKASGGEPTNKKPKFTLQEDDEEEDEMIAAAEQWGADNIIKALAAAQAMKAAKTLTLQTVKNWFGTAPQEIKEGSGLKDVEDELANRHKLTKPQSAAIVAQIINIMTDMQAACLVPEDDDYGVVASETTLSKVQESVAKLHTMAAQRNCSVEGATQKNLAVLVSEWSEKLKEKVGERATEVSAPTAMSKENELAALDEFVTYFEGLQQFMEQQGGASAASKK